MQIALEISLELSLLDMICANLHYYFFYFQIFKFVFRVFYSIINILYFCTILGEVRALSSSQLIIINLAIISPKITKLKLFSPWFQFFISFIYLCIYLFFMYVFIYLFIYLFICFLVKLLHEFEMLLVAIYINFSLFVQCSIVHSLIGQYLFRIL